MGPEGNALCWGLVVADVVEGGGGGGGVGDGVGGRVACVSEVEGRRRYGGHWDMSRWDAA